MFFQKIPEERPFEEALADNYELIKGPGDDSKSENTVQPTAVSMVDKLRDAAQSSGDTANYLIKTWLPRATKEWLKDFEDKYEPELEVVEVPLVACKKLEQELSRLNGALAKKTAHVARLVQHQRHMAVKIEKHVTNMVDNVKQQGQADRDKALAAQTTQHTQQLQSLQQQHAAHLQNLSSKQNAQPQNRVAQSSDAKRKQYYAWLQDQVTSCKAELGVQKQRSSPALLQQSSSMSQSQLAQPTEQQQRCQADLQSKIAGLQKAMEECKAHMQQPSVVELQQHVSQLEEQLQNDRTELQRHRAQPTTAQLQQRVTQLETALKQQSDGFADQMQKVQTGVEKAKKSFFHSAQLREDDLKQRHAATLTAQDEMLKCQASKVTRLVRENEELRAKLSELQEAAVAPSQVASNDHAPLTVDNRSIVDDESALTALLSAYDAQHKSDRTPSRTDANGAVDSNSTETSNMPSFDDSSITSDSSFSAASIGKPAVSTIASAELNSSCGAAMPSAPLDCNSQGIDTVMSNDDSSKQLHIRADADGPTGRSRAAANSPSAEGSAGVSGFIKQNKVAASPPTVKARADAVEFAKGSSARPALCQSTMNMRHSDHSSLVSCPRVEGGTSFTLLPKYCLQATRYLLGSPFAQARQSSAYTTRPARLHPARGRTTFSHVPVHIQGQASQTGLVHSTAGFQYPRVEFQCCS